MNIADAIAGIRVVREFAAESLDDDVISAICNAGRRAGSSKNLQRWAFVVVEDRQRLDELSGVGPYAGHVRGAACAIALVTPDPHADDAPLSILFDLGRAAQNMVLRAWDCGVGSCPATVYDHDVARSVLGYPETHHCEYVISFGYPADVEVLTTAPRAGGRSDIASIVHHETW